MYSRLEWEASFHRWVSDPSRSIYCHNSALGDEWQVLISNIIRLQNKLSSFEWQLAYLASHRKRMVWRYRWLLCTMASSTGAAEGWSKGLLTFESWDGRRLRWPCSFGMQHWLYILHAFSCWKHAAPTVRSAAVFCICKNESGDVSPGSHNFSCVNRRNGIIKLFEKLSAVDLAAASTKRISSQILAKKKIVHVPVQGNSCNLWPLSTFNASLIFCSQFQLRRWQHYTYYMKATVTQVTQDFDKTL